LRRSKSSQWEAAQGADLKYSARLCRPIEQAHQQASSQIRASRRQHRAKRHEYIMLQSNAAPVPAVGFAIVAFQRAILDGIVVNANALAIRVHLNATVADAPRRGAAIGAVAAELAMSSYEIAVDVMGLNWPRSER
jgi:hypothetical protein